MQNYGIFKKKHQDSVSKQVCNCQFTIPEVKIVFVIFYWLIHSLMVWTASSIRAGREDIFSHNLRSFADCMSGGIRRDHDCHKLRIDLEAEMNPVLEIMTFISIAFLNFATLSFVIQFQTVKNSVRQVAKKLSTKYSY